MKRKMSENSLKNLENRKPFSHELALKNQEKSAAKRKENNIAKKAYKEVASEFLKKLIGNGAMDVLTNPDNFESISTKDRIAILEHLADYSGQKPANKVEQDLSVSASLTTIDFGGEE